MQKRFVTIWFRHLKTDWFSRRHPYLKEKAFVLASPDHGRMIVTAVNPSAQAKGVYPGMVVADARAIIHGLTVLDDPPGLSAKLLHNLSHWCIRYTPVVAVDMPDGLILDASGCAHLWKGETPYINDISQKLRNFGYHVTLSISDTIGCSWAMSRHCKGNTIIESGKHMEELLPLPPEALRFDHNTVDRLKKLGLRQLKDFIGIPRHSLSRRFGKDILKRIDQALGYEEELIEPIQPVEPYQQRLPCLEPIVHLQGVEIAVHRLLEDICTRLIHEQKGLRAAILKGFMSDGRIEKIEISTSHPSNNLQHLFKLFELKFPIFNTDNGVEVFVLEVTKVESIHSTQEILWNTSPHIGNRDLSELVDRISAKYGEGLVKRFVPDEHYWPERSYKPAASLDEKVSAPWNVQRPRPLLLLEKPETIEVTAPIPDYPPMNFRHKNILHKVVKADGPERIEQEWWIENGHHRDYYYVEDEEGKRYWIFRLGHYTEEKNYCWYLHGYFA